MPVEPRSPAVCNGSNKMGGKGEMTKAPISLQDLRRSLYVKAKAEGPITLGRKQAGKPSAGNPHAGFDEAGTGNPLTARLVRHSQRKRRVNG